MDLNAFVDELTKISGISLAPIGKAISSSRSLVKTSPNLIKYPLIAGSGIGMWELMRRAKRRYDIGKAYEEAQGG